MKIQSLSHLLLQVSDLDRAVEFYTRVAGLHVRDRSALADGRRFVAMHEGLGLTTFPEGADRHGMTCDHIAFRCDAVEPVIHALDAHGLPHEGPRRTPYGLSVYFTDPDGNRIECHDTTGAQAGRPD